jgi:HD-GYP domain-containing protein (c-di-GMP phosphodiesterase class II)
MNEDDQIRQVLTDRLREIKRLFDGMPPPAGGVEPPYEGWKEAAPRYRTLLKIAESIAANLEERDPFKKGHQYRVMDLAGAIGEAMNLDSRRIEGLRVGSLLHDIGKIFIPSGLLLKPTRLTAAENQLVITHVRSGNELLQDIPFPWPVTRMLLEHHERIDGSGYPDGLRGESLILESRILAVADVVDAIASPRSYRPARGIEVALYDIKGFRGIRYDPDVVDACLMLFEEKNYRLPMDYD